MFNNLFHFNSSLSHLYLQRLYLKESILKKQADDYLQLNYNGKVKASNTFNDTEENTKTDFLKYKSDAIFTKVDESRTNFSKYSLLSNLEARQRLVYEDSVII